MPHALPWRPGRRPGRHPVPPGPDRSTSERRQHNDPGARGASWPERPGARADSPPAGSRGGLAVSPGFDASTPNMARVYDCWLGGKDNYAADRAEARRLLRIYPPLRAMARENRAFLARAVTWAAEQGISQFLDLGAGLPAGQNTHQAARAVNPAAAVAYVDTDPVVLAHARALLATSDGVTAVAADLRDPAAVLADPGLRAVIDLARPVAVLLGAVLHFLDADAARQVTAGYARPWHRAAA